MSLKNFEVSGGQDGFKNLFARLQKELIAQPQFDVGEWQSQHKEMLMRELRNVSFSIELPKTPEQLATITGAHLPWAEDHFLERVGRRPLNPSPSEAWWPFAQKKASNTNADHKSEGEAFSHTYPERMWPKFANMPDFWDSRPSDRDESEPHEGIRFAYGDLWDVVNQLAKSPKTRQAYLPIWFPEDTGAVHGKRVPCTLGYHFAIRDGKLDITYYMRSTDLLRHFQDDVYLAGRLAQWMVQQINDVDMTTSLEPTTPLLVGELIFHTANLHIFDGDVPIIEWRRSQGQMSWPEH